MSNELQTSYQPGSTIYSTIHNEAGLVWATAGQVFEAWGTAGRTAADYDISLTDKSGGQYVGNFDANIATGVYFIFYHLQTGGAPVDADPNLSGAPDRVRWSGSRIVYNDSVTFETTISNKVTDDGTTMVFDLVDGSSDDDEYNGDAITIEDATGTMLNTGTFAVEDYDGGNKRITIDDTAAFNIAVGDIVRIWRGSGGGGGGSTAQQIWEYVTSGITTPGQAGYENRTNPLDT